MNWDKFWTIIAQVLMTLVILKFAAYIVKETIDDWRSKK